jgi:hypothetical protein
MDIPIGASSSINMGELNKFEVRIGMQANLGLFGLFEINAPAFDFTFEFPDTGDLIPRIDLSELMNFDFSIPDTAPSWLRDGLDGVKDALKNVELSISIDGITGSIDIPNLTIELADFIYFQGDFKLTLGDTFTADAYTGIDPMLGGAIDSMLDLATNELAKLAIGDELDLSDANLVQRLLGFNEDFSVLEGVNYTGTSFGASNVNLFVGGGRPDFNRPLADQGLIGFGMQDLDLAIGVYTPTLPGVLDTLFGDSVKDVVSIKATADELGAYGFGDFLKILGRDITLEYNDGGQWLELFRAMPIYSGMTTRKTEIDPETLQVTTTNYVGHVVGTGDEPVALDFNGPPVMGLDIGLAEISLADFVHLRGSLAFRKGEIYNVKIDPGGLGPLLNDIGDVSGVDLNNINLNVQAMTLGGANLEGFAGIGGPYRYGPDLNQDGILDYVNASAVGLEIHNVDFGFAIFKPMVFTMSPQLEQYSPMWVSAKASIERAGLVGIDEAILSAELFDVEVNINTFLIPNAPAPVNLALQLFGPPTINFKESASFKDFTEDVNLNGVLDLGEDLNNNLRLDPGEDANGDGVLQLSEDRNQNGKIDRAGFALPAGGNNMVFIDFDEEIIQAKVGYAEINLGGVLQMSASMAFTKRSGERVTLSNGEETIVTTMAIGINDANAFLGVPTMVDGQLRGYFYDSNGDDRIDEEDDTNQSAVGLVIEDLDLGLLVAAETYFSLERVSIGVYIAGRATVNTIKLNGVPGVTMATRDVALEINTGVRVSLDIGEITKDPVTGAVSYNTNVQPSFGFTTIDFTQSTWLRPSEDANGNGVLDLGEDRGNGMLDAGEDRNNNGRLDAGEDRGNGVLDVEMTLPGYAIETGNPFEPIVLDFKSNFLRIFGEMEVNMFGLVKLDGALDFSFSEEEGLTAFADVSVQVGPDGFGLKSDATGLIVINSGGAAMRLDLSTSLDLGPVASLDVAFQLSLNSFGRDIVYVVPEQLRDRTGFESFTVSAAPPGKPTWVGPYVALTGKGDLTLMSALTLKGDFAMIASYANDEFRLELGVSADLAIEPLARLNATGTLGFVASGEGAGFYGSLEIGGAGQNSVILDGGSAFSISGRFLLQINTTNQTQQARGRDALGNVYDTDGNPIMVDLTPLSLKLSGRSEVAIGPISMLGAVDFQIDSSGIQVAMQVVLDLGAFGEIQVAGAAAIGVDANDQPFFALYMQFQAEMNIAILKIQAGATLRINTSDLDYTTLQGELLPGRTFFDLELIGKIDLFLFEVDFYGRMSVIDDVFKLEFAGSLNFFNITTVEMAGYVDSNGNFEFRGKIEIDIYMGPLHLNAGASLILSSQPRFAAAVWGSLDFELNLGFVSIDFTIAGFRGEIDITAASAYLAARVTVMGISVSGSYLWSWTDPPKISRLVGDTLVLNMGDAAGRYGESEYDEIVNEGVSVEFDAERDEYIVRSLGGEERYRRDRVKTIRGSGGSGNDSFYIGQGVDARLDLDGGLGNDSFLIQGGTAGSIVSGGAGNDEFLNGTSAGIYYFGDDRPASGYAWVGRYTGATGNDRFVGGGGAVTVDMGLGNDSVSTGPSADTVIVRGGNTKIDTGAGGDTIFLDPTYGGGNVNITGGSGFDKLVIQSMESTGDLVLGAMQLVHEAPTGYLTVNFNDKLDRIEMTDTAAQTVLRSTADVNWRSTDFSLRASGTVDVSEATFVAADALLSISGNRLVGVFNTEVAALSLEARDTSGVTSDLVVNEADSLSLVADRWSLGGLFTHQGDIRVSLAATESLLSLDSGWLSTGTGGGTIEITADDIDFASGRNRVAGSGLLVISAQTDGQAYRIGGAGQSLFGRDQSVAGATGFMALSMADLDALADGFQEVQIGDNSGQAFMIVGDVKDAAVGIFDFQAKLTDALRLSADEIVIAGNVQVAGAISTHSRLLQIRALNFQAPLGMPDSGLSAQRLDLNVTEQVDLSGWLIAQERIDLDVSASTGNDA